MFDIPFESIFFFFFAFIGIIFSIFAVTTTKLVHSAVSLMAVLTISAAYYLMLGAEFMAGIQMLLYVGGVLILIVFAIMVTSSNELIQTKPDINRRTVALFISVLFFITSVYVFSDDFFKTNTRYKIEDEIAAIGNSFLNYQENGQILSFELISLILLAALIGGIVIGRKDTPEHLENK